MAQQQSGRTVSEVAVTREESYPKRLSNGALLGPKEGIARGKMDDEGNVSTGEKYLKMVLEHPTNARRYVNLSEPRVELLCNLTDADWQIIRDALAKMRRKQEAMGNGPATKSNKFVQL